MCPRPVRAVGLVPPAARWLHQTAEAVAEAVDEPIDADAHLLGEGIQAQELVASWRPHPVTARSSPPSWSATSTMPPRTAAAPGPRDARGTKPWIWTYDVGGGGIGRCWPPPGTPPDPLPAAAGRTYDARRSCPRRCCTASLPRSGSRPRMAKGDPRSPPSAAAATAASASDVSDAAEAITAARVMAPAVSIPRAGVGGDARRSQLGAWTHASRACTQTCTRREEWARWAASPAPMPLPPP